MDRIRLKFKLLLGLSIFLLDFVSDILLIFFLNSFRLLAKIFLLLTLFKYLKLFTSLFSRIHLDTFIPLSSFRRECVSHLKFNFSWNWLTFFIISLQLSFFFPFWQNPYIHETNLFLYYVTHSELKYFFSAEG